MRLVGWPSQWSKEEGLQPVYLQEIDIHASSEDLRALSAFFAQAAVQVDLAACKNSEAREEIKFPDFSPNATLPITISAVYESNNALIPSTTD